MGRSRVDEVVRRVLYLTGTRADFGLMTSTLSLLRDDPRFALSLIVTGTHLSHQFGYTVREIESTGLSIEARVPVELESCTGTTMARNIGSMLVDFVGVLERRRPDILLLLGDRGEMLAGAIAGLHLGIPIAHIHGGERSGTVDEPIRHAISKLSHLHFVATEQSRNRLIRMGEHVNRVWTTGAPGLDGLRDRVGSTRETLCNSIGFDPLRPLALFIYHPVLEEAQSAGTEASLILNAILEAGLQVLGILPNADGGSDAVRESLRAFDAQERVLFATHLPRDEFVSWMAASDVMVGNSSSGIIEAATFGTPVVNVGSRQNMRERNKNVVDVNATSVEVRSAVEAALRHKKLPRVNLYGDGNAGARIVELLATVALTRELMTKCNAY